MKVVVVKSPKVISGLMRLIFKIKKEEEEDNWRYSCECRQFFCYSRKALRSQERSKSFFYFVML